MAENAYMDGKDVVAGSLGSVYVVLDGRRYNAMQFINVSAKMEKTKVTVDILGKSGKGNKSTGWKGTGSATLHYCNSLFRKKMVEYAKTGKDFYFDMQVTNDDETSAAGRQTTILKNCNIDSAIIAQVDASTDQLNEDMDFTFDGVELPETFNDLEGM